MIKNIVIVFLGLFALILLIAPCSASEERTTVISDNRDCAVSSAMTNIPSISHHKHTSHQAIGAAVGTCEGENAVAVGLNVHKDDTSFKASLGVSGGTRGAGIGMSVGF